LREADDVDMELTTPATGKAARPAPVPAPAVESRATGGRRRVPLPGGGELVVRPVSPGDVDGLVALYEGLSDDDRYRRFFSCFDPDRSFFERAVSVEARGGYGLVAVESGDATGPRGADGYAPGAAAGGRIVGEASYELLPDGDGELAMTVADDRRGWLGPFLLDALIEAAAERGVPNLEADVLVTNSRMLTLLRARGYATLPSDDWVTVRLIVGTAGRTPVWPDGAGATGHRDRPRVLVEAPGGRWHARREAAAAGLQVVTCSGPRGARSRCPVLAGRPCPLAAAADAVVVSHAPDDERWRALVEAHGDVHPGVPVCVEPRPVQAPGGGAPAAGGVPGDAEVIDVDDPQLVVSIVDRIASAHRRAAEHRPAARRAGEPAPTPPGNGTFDP
jgi:GNAT superfamily N-acetyltransferase